MFGYSPEEAQGRQANQLLAGPFTDRKTLARLRRRICDGSSDEEEVLAYDKNGDEIWVSATVKPFRNDRGRIKYLFALLTDITESKQLRSLQQLIMGALADELPLTEIADQLCRRVEAIAPDVVSSVLHIDSDGLVHPLGGPSLPDDVLPRARRRRHRARHRLVRIGGLLRRSRCWRRISTTTRAGSRSRRCRSRPA